MLSAIPDNYPALVKRAATEFTNVEAIKDGNISLTYSELSEQIDQCSAALAASGIEPGDRVAVWAPNTWEWVVAGLAVLNAGAVLVPVNTRFKGREAAYVLRKAEVKLLFTVVGFLGNDYVADLRTSGEEIESLQEIIVLRGEHAEGTVPFQVFLKRSDENYLNQVRTQSRQINGDDLGLIMFTSGTTGLPKGVLVKQGPILRGFAYYARELSIRTGDRMLIINPFFHAFGFNGAITPCLMHGATMLPNPVFEVADVLQRIQDDRITVLPGPPAIFQSLINSGRLAEFDTTSLRSALTGAASVPVETVVAMREQLGFEVVITAYGMTETHGLVTICSADDPPELVATTSGKALPGIESRLVDDDGLDVEVGTPGELLVRGFCVMGGYLDDPEQTKEAIDEDGWLKTGDICVMDANGYIDITDRKKDMFINGGFNAYPAEIEQMMLDHPDIGQVAVIGVPDERLGEVGAAFIVPTPTSEPNVRQILGWCREQMANYKAPRYCWVVDSLPLNPSNKVLKTDLREMAHNLTKETHS